MSGKKVRFQLYHSIDYHIALNFPLYELIANLFPIDWELILFPTNLLHSQGSWIALAAFLLILSSAVLSAREALLSDPEEQQAINLPSGNQMCCIVYSWKNLYEVRFIAGNIDLSIYTYQGI
jgi:hypothetical protein